MTPLCRGRPTILSFNNEETQEAKRREGDEEGNLGKIVRGASSPANPAFIIPEEFSMTKELISSSSWARGTKELMEEGEYALFGAEGGAAEVTTGA